MKYNKFMSLALSLILIGAGLAVIGGLFARTALGQTLWFLGGIMVIVGIIIFLFIKLITKRQDNSEKNKW